MSKYSNLIGKSKRKLERETNISGPHKYFFSNFLPKEQKNKASTHPQGYEIFCHILGKCKRLIILQHREFKITVFAHEWRIAQMFLESSGIIED